MKTKILILLAIPVLFYMCKKDAYTTKPQISIKTIGPSPVAKGSVLSIQLQFTDAEGDIQDTLWVQKVSKVCPNSGGNFKVGYPVPDFTPTTDLKGFLELNFAYNANISGLKTISGCNGVTDTAYFRFWLVDKAKNSSDTINSDNIVLLK